MNEKIFDIKERTFRYSINLIKFYNTIPENASNKVLLRQMIRAGTSIGANVAEGYAGSSKKDFINYYNISLKTANETIYWLKLLKEVNSEAKGIDDLINEAGEISKVLAKIIINCRR